MEVEFFCGLAGLILLPAIAWLISVDRTKVMWKTVVVGLLIQLTLGVVVMLTTPGQQFFQYMNDIVIGLLKFSNEGAKFLFGDLINPGFAGAQFAFSVLPTIIFFSAVMSILYYTGLMQKIVEFVAWVMMKLLGTSGAETLSVSANIFVGQTESPLVVKPFIKDMTRSELNTIMTGGFSTVAGGVMAAYVGMLYSHFPSIAGHLITASVMSAPAAIVMSKLAFPETARPDTLGQVEMDVEEQNQNLIDAAAQGAKTGLTLALNVGAMLLAFIALVHLGNFLVEWLGGHAYQLFTQASGFQGAFPGIMVGFVIGVFLIAGQSWKNELTREWIASIFLCGLLPVSGYFLVPELFVTRLKWGGDVQTWAIGGLIAGLIVGTVSTIRLEKNRLPRLVESLITLGLFTAISGFLTYLTAGSNSSVIAALLLGGFIGFIGAVPLYWQSLSYGTFLKLSLIGLVTGLVAAGLTYVFQIPVIELTGSISLEKMFGYAFSVLAFLMGVPWEDLVHFGELIGHKVVVNEFVAFLNFKQMAAAGTLSPRSLVIASYALTGFANFSSIAIQIGGIGGIAPSRESDLAELGLRAMVCGALASFQTAAVAGVMYGLAQQMGIDLVTL